MNRLKASGDLYDTGRFRGMISHNTHDTVTDLYSGGYAFHLGMGCDRNVLASDISFATTYTNDVGQLSGYDNQMNPEINAESRAGETTMFTAGDGYYKYYQVDGTTQGAASGIGQITAQQAEVNQWYSFLINPGNDPMDDGSLSSITDSGNVFYPWMSMAAVSSFPHNDLGKDFRFNIRILHYGGRGYPYYFTGYDTVTANSSRMATANALMVS